MTTDNVQNPTTACEMDDFVARLRLRARYPDSGKVDGLPAAHDWNKAADEIDRLRRIEGAAQLQHEVYGAYPGLIKALGSK